MGGQRGKITGGGLALPSFEAGGMRTPSLNPSASGSVAGAELASEVSYDNLVQVLRVGVAESVADVAALLEEVGWLQVGLGLAGVSRPQEAIGNMRLVPKVRAHLLEGVRRLGESLEKSEGWAIELPRLRKVVVEREVEVWKVAREVRNMCIERDMAKSELESMHVELVSARRAVNCEEPKAW